MKIEEKFEQLFRNELGEDEARALLVELYEKGESGEEIAAAASVMRSHAVALPLPERLRQKAIDVVGTGGDKSGSFNISTTVSLLLASMGRVVAKHGNRSITSKSGSADLLEALGINLNLSTQAQLKLIEETGFAFIFAMNHHPAMKHIMPIRKSIPHRTIFNILGPLTNPAHIKKYLLGVFDPAYIKPMAQALVALDTQRAFVVSSFDGMDEISLATQSQFAYVENGRIFEGVIDPEIYGFKKAPKEAILGGDAQENATITRTILSGTEQGPKRDIVLLNAAYALFAEGSVRNIQEAIALCKETIQSGKAIAHIEKIATLSQQLSDGRA